MITFLIKFTLSLVLFYLFYKFVLEREKMHHINRVLLLFALVFSIVIPFLSIELISKNPVINNLPAYVIPEIHISGAENNTYLLFSVEQLLWVVYIVGFVGFMVRFVRNILSLYAKINHNDTIKKDDYTLVLVKENVLPHSFLNHIFVNADDYKTNSIDDELIVHEQTHIIQKHSFDILFVELLQVVFWVHPMMYVYKKAIKLNHEFLADQSVNKLFGKIVHYQNLLLQKASGQSLIPVASNLNYSITKKRFIMMTKQTSKWHIVSKTTVSIALFFALFLSLSVKITAQEKATATFSKDEISQALVKEDSVHTTVHIRPDYPGGMEKFYKFVSDNYNIPKEATNLSGMIIANFVVEKDGTLSNIEIRRDLGFGTGEEAIRVLNLSEKWLPGIVNGKKVRVMYTLPLKFNTAQTPNTKKQ